jgi:uncharacterized membrane protein YhaH (DUF805 family)
MVQYIVGIIIILAFYGIIINKVDSGRCFRYEYIIKTLIIIGIEIICLSLFFINVWPVLRIIGFILILAAMYFSLKFTIQRFYDLDISGWYILLKLIPIVSIFVTFYLYLKKGKPEINVYDKAIDYKKLFTDRHCIDIYKDKFIIGNETYQYELYMGNYSIKISKYSGDDFFKEYLLNNYQYKKESVYNVIELSKDEFEKIIKTLNLIVINNSFFLQINNFEVFIRKENFRYTIILDKGNNEVSKVLFDFFDFSGSFYEDEKNIYYNRIDKQDLLKWVKNVT